MAFETFGSRRVPRLVLDPSCGGGVFLIAAAEALLGAGLTPDDALGRLAGIDLDPGAVATTRAALGAWAAAHGLDERAAEELVTLRAGDAFTLEWGDPEVVVGNPPFQGQLSNQTRRDATATAVVRERFGAAALGYVDNALLFLLAAVQAVGADGVVAMIQPWSSLATAHGSTVRRTIHEHARIAAAWIPDGRVFDAAVEVWAPVLVAGGRDGHEVVVCSGSQRRRVTLSAPWQWSEIAAEIHGVPAVHVDGPRRVGDIATAVSGFRDEFYAVAANVREGADDEPGAFRVVTSGAIDPLTLRWGGVPARVGGTSWARPVVDRSLLAGAGGKIARWAARQDGPKVLVASQTRVIEAAADPDGTMLGLTPTVALRTEDARTALLMAAALSAPSLSALAARRCAGSGRSRAALRISAAELAALPLPADLERLAPALAAHQSGAGWKTVGALADRAFGIERPDVVEWWSDQLPRRVQR